MTDNYVIELVRDVKNPEPDRRSKDWTKLTIVPAGTRLIVSPKRDNYVAIENNTKGWPWTTTHSPLGKVVLANAERREPESWYELAIVEGCITYAGSILEDLLKIGRITRADFEAVAEYQNEEADREAAAEEALRAAAKDTWKRE